MKRMKNLKHSLIFLSMAALVFTACSDNTADETTTPPSTDVKWDLDEYMDTSVKPGDDFARYCWGKWYDNAGEPIKNELGSISEAQAATKQKMGKMEDKEMKQLESDIAKFETFEYAYDDDGHDDVRATMKKLRAQLDNPDALEVAKLLGEFYASGRNCMVQCYYVSNAEKNYFYVTMEDSLYVSDFVPNKNIDLNIQLAWYMSFGSSVFTEDKGKDLILSLLYDKFEPDADADEQFKKYTPAQITQAFCQAMGISTDQLLNGNLLGNVILQGRTMILKSMIWSVASDMALIQRDRLTQLAAAYNISDAKTFLSAVISSNKLLDYPRSKEYCEKYCTEALHQKVLGLMEDMRTTFAQRIDNLEWMSNTTKQAAKKKLAAMEFYALYPDKWYDTGFPQLEGKSLYFDVKAMRLARRNLQKELLSVNPRKDFLNVIFASQRPAFTVNCSYAPLVNCACIFAPMVSEPLYSLSDPDAKLYAIGTTLGHEMTHAFDNDGAKYGPTGEKENWWMVSDKQDFDKRTQLLVDCYNHLPAYQGCDANVFAKGTKTLGENIADIGGLELALQAYTTKLEQQGVQGDELAKNQKRFFQAYANYWRSKNSTDYNEALLKVDVHANDYTRLLGSTMNCNRWYELYDVKWGDKNYLRPESRTHIW